jgi:hypothetical protein
MGRSKGWGRKKGPKTLEEKIYDLDKSFADEVRVGTVEQVKEKLIGLDKNEKAIEEAKTDDSDLASKREALKVANETYSVPLKAIRLKRTFALKVLAEKGVK